MTTATCFQRLSVVTVLHASKKDIDSAASLQHPSGGISIVKNSSNRWKIYLTNSGIHNPTGAVLSMQTAFEIAKIAEKNGLYIIEDEIFSDFEYVPAPRYLTLLGLKQVIQIGSFTKTLSALTFMARFYQKTQRLLIF